MVTVVTHEVAMESQKAVKDQKQMLVVTVVVMVQVVQVILTQIVLLTF
jgi:hypothetical protein